MTRDPAIARPPNRVRAFYAKQCAGCHGADAHGTDRGPGLAGNRRLPQPYRGALARLHPKKGSPAVGRQYIALATFKTVTRSSRSRFGAIRPRRARLQAVGGLRGLD